MPCRLSRNLVPATTLALLAAACWPIVAHAVDIDGIQPAALDQPRVNATISVAGSASPYVADFVGIKSFNVEAFYDTGASGVMISQDTAGALGMLNSTVDGKDVIFVDVGVAGSDRFNVSTAVDIRLAPYHPATTELITAAEDEYSSLGTFTTLPSIYTQTFAGIRTQVGPAGVTPSPGMEGLDVLGVPTMAGKVMVMDTRPVNTFDDTIRTYVYNPGTSFNAATADTNPGIPQPTHRIALSYATLDRFTQTLLHDTSTNPPTETLLTPAQAAGVGPTLAGNPFIGPNPVHKLDASVPAGNAPGITIALDTPVGTQVVTRQSHGSWLLDTGAAASMISTSQAAALGVHYLAGTEDTDNPVLVDSQENPLPNQFTFTIGGVGGVKKTAGFFLSSLLVPTKDGALIPSPDGWLADPNDPNHIRFLNAPVLVNDITVVDPASYDQLTGTYGSSMVLDGILGMNFLVASCNLTEIGGIPWPSDLTAGAFDWVVFDQPNAELGLTVSVPEPASIGFICIAALLLQRRRFAA